MRKEVTMMATMQDVPVFHHCVYSHLSVLESRLNAEYLSQQQTLERICIRHAGSMTTDNCSTNQDFVQGIHLTENIHKEINLKQQYGDYHLSLFILRYQLR